MTILFVCESAGKIKKISKILGKDYLIKASNGNFRDLNAKTMSVDFDNNYQPIYVITKPDVVKNLRAAMKSSDSLYIASDLDLEGEAIAQHLYEVLKPKKYKRIIFNEITKEGIMNGIKNAGQICQNKVDAQKTRRILDRIFGYTISPLLNKQFGGKLSAGRVQSVTTKLIIDKENEIQHFLNTKSDSTYYRVSGNISDLKVVLYQMSKIDSETKYKGKVAQIPLSDEEPDANVMFLLKKCQKSKFIVHSVESKEQLRNPSPPFETCTLQQEANRKFGMSIDVTMKTAQKLYEGGYITYMRTDSVEISKEGHDLIKKVVQKKYGKDYYQKNIYPNKSASSQEAHEAIRPTNPDLTTLKNETEDLNQIKLYKLIWQRTIASQMKPAKINVTIVQIDISKYLTEKLKPYYYFQSQIEKIIFPGFMKVYQESVDDPTENDTMTDFQGKIPKKNSQLSMNEIIAKQEYARPPPRYSEASLVKMLKKLGIGRPSTYVNTIKTIINRGYVKIGNPPGVKKDINIFTIKCDNNKIQKKNSTLQIGKENKKIIPTDLGVTINDFLLEHFSELLDYNFTAKLEEEMDQIANGNKVWYKVVKKFHQQIIPIVSELAKNAKKENSLGLDNEQNEIFITKTKYGPAVKKEINGKTVYASIKKPLTCETITLDDAIKLFEYPKLLGKLSGKEIYLHQGKSNFYLKYDNQNYFTDSSTEINLETAKQIIQKKISEIIKDCTIVIGKKKVRAVILEGPYGYYLKVYSGKKPMNYQIPKQMQNPKTLKKLSELEIKSIMTKKKSGSKKFSK